MPTRLLSLCINSSCMHSLMYCAAANVEHVLQKSWSVILTDIVHANLLHNM